MKRRKTLTLILMIFLLPALLLSAQVPDIESKKDIFAPFASRFKASVKGSSILISWKDARNLENAVYQIYASPLPFNSRNFNAARLLDTVEAGVEQYLYEPKDGEERYFLILAREEEQLYNVLIPYRNMTMTALAAELPAVEEEKAALLSNLKALPDRQEIQISGLSSNGKREVILFRSTEKLTERSDLLKAARVTNLTGNDLQWRDKVVPGIPFYYALVDRDLFSSGSTALLYEGSVTLEPVLIPLEEWAPAEAHSFQFFSRHIPLPVLNIRKDIESGNPLHGPEHPLKTVELSSETELQLASMNFGKSVRPTEWMESRILRADREKSLHKAIEGIPALLEDQNWAAVIDKTTQELRHPYEKEIQARLRYYRGQAYYFTTQLELAFMDFLTARELYYSESELWMAGILNLRQLQTRKEKVEF